MRFTIGKVAYVLSWRKAKKQLEQGSCRMRMCCEDIAPSLVQHQDVLHAANFSTMLSIGEGSTHTFMLLEEVGLD